MLIEPNLNIKEKDNGNLLLWVDRPEELQDELDTQDYEAYIWRDLLEPYFTNGEYEPIDPEVHFIGLTSDPYVLAEEGTIEDNGDMTVFGKLWRYPDYMITSVVERLANGENVELRMFDEVTEPTTLETFK